MTGTLKAKVNGQWVPVGGGSTPSQQWNSAWGVVADLSVRTGGDFAATATETTMISGAFTAVTGRRYRIVARIVATATADNAGVQGTVKLDGANAFILDQQVKNGNLAYAVHGDQLFGTLASGSHTVALNIVKSWYAAGNGIVARSADYPVIFYVEDVGPAAGASVVPNPYMPIYKAQAVQQTITPAQGLANAIGLTIPNLQVGQQALIHFNAAVTQPTAGVFDLVFVYNNMGPNNQQSSNAAGTILNFSAMVAGTGANVACFVQINAWGGQSVVVSSMSSIIAVVYPV